MSTGTIADEGPARVGGDGEGSARWAAPSMGEEGLPAGGGELAWAAHGPGAAPAAVQPTPSSFPAGSAAPQITVGCSDEGKIIYDHMHNHISLIIHVEERQQSNHLRFYGYLLSSLFDNEEVIT